MNEVILHHTGILENRVDFDYSYPEGWNVFIQDPSERLFVEYGFDLAAVPVSILIIPFVANMIVHCMFDNGVIRVPELDKTFYEAIPSILDGYRKLYPDKQIACTVLCDCVLENVYTAYGDKLMAFTGGVDATSAMATHRNEKLTLCNIWGGDITLDNETRYLAHRKYFEVLSARCGYGFESVKSNFRFLYDDTKIPHKFRHDWWDAVGHAFLIAATFAPIAFAKKASCVYLASTHTVKEYETFRPHSANTQCIVNAIAFASCRVQQSDPHLQRVHKIQNIVQTLQPAQKGEIQILACWNHKKDSVNNCCRCEKCARTIMNIKACKADPALFGFTMDKDTVLYIKNLVTYGKKLPYDMWKEIQNEFLADRNHWKADKSVNWILNLEINNPKKPPLIKSAYWEVRRLAGNLKRKLI